MPMWATKSELQVYLYLISVFQSTSSYFSFEILFRLLPSRYKCNRNANGVTASSKIYQAKLEPNIKIYALITVSINLSPCKVPPLPSAGRPYLTCYRGSYLVLHIAVFSLHGMKCAAFRRWQFFQIDIK